LNVDFSVGYSILPIFSYLQGNASDCLLQTRNCGCVDNLNWRSGCDQKQTSCSSCHGWVKPCRTNRFDECGHAFRPQRAYPHRQAPVSDSALVWIFPCDF